MPWNFFFSIVNSGPKAKVLKVRYREAVRGRALLEHNLYLGPNDMWVAALVPGATLIVPDNSCSDPFIPSAGITLPITSFTGSASDGAGDTADRTLEGFIEVIEMGTVTGATADAIAMQADGTPVNCAAVTGAGKQRTIGPPEGGIYGSGYLINVTGGWSASYPAVALADLTTASFYTDVGQPGTDFDSPQVTPISIVTVPTFDTTGFIGTAT
jgi:hypothetical protein